MIIATGFRSSRGNVLWILHEIELNPLLLCSYLGFGLMAGRAAVLAWEETKQANPCIPSDHTGVYEYGGLSYDLVAAPSGASFETCGKLVTMVLKQDLDCGAPAVRPLPPLETAYWTLVVQVLSTAKSNFESDEMATNWRCCALLGKALRRVSL